MNICHTSVQTIVCTTPRVNTKENYGLHDYDVFILGKKCTILVSGVDNGGDCVSVGAEGVWKISTFLSILLKI